VKRFWEQAEIGVAERGYDILLDGKPIHLPGGTILTVGSEALARAIAAEWQSAGGSQGGEMSFADTPLTRLAGTAQERIAPDPRPTIDALARYAETDLLCYRADRPPALVHRQAQEWQPWLDWVARTYDAPLRVGVGVVHIKQDPQALAALRLAVAGLDLPSLAALSVTVPTLGSLVLGLALAERRVDAATAHRLAALDELFQVEAWGEDLMAARRRRLIAAELHQAARFMELAHHER
jgi:chaperone required for assembly of F1-ATPase